MDSAQRNVLIVDAAGDGLIRRMLAERSSFSFLVAEATSGEEGLRLWQEQEPDCVLLSDQLPDLDSLELLAAHAKAGGRSAAPVILLTNDIAAGIEAIRRGAQDFLIRDKLAPAELVRVVISVI